MLAEQLSKQLSKQPLRLFLFGVGLVLVATLAGIFALSLIKPASNNSVLQTSKESPVALRLIDLTGNRDYQIAWQESENTLQYLQRLDQSDADFSFATVEFPGTGKFVTKFNGLQANSDNEFWKFSINGNESMVGVEQYQVKPNDKLEFSLTTFSL